MARSKSFDYLISFLIFAVSLFGSVITYAHILREQKQHVLASGKFPIGRQSHTILSNNNCVGYVDTSLEVLGNGFVYKATGSLSAKAQGTLIEPEFTLEGQYNSIGQLGASLLRVNLLGGFISIGTSEINPINLKIRINLGDLRAEHSLQFPGPIELKRAGKDSFFVQHGAMSAILDGPSKFLAQPLLSSIKLELETRPDGAPKCQNLNASFIDIDSFSGALKAIVGKMNNLTL